MGSTLRAGALAALLLLPTASAAERHPAPDPPELPGAGPAPPLDLAPRGAAPSVEWVLHKSADGAHPDADEQALLWLMNRARQDPSAEGFWLATESDPDVAGGRSFFGVDTALLQQEFDALAPAPPAAFDRRLHAAAELHSLDLIARDAQDHTGQADKVNASGFSHSGGRLSVFSYADSALNAHAAFNIDWGPGDGTGMQPGRGHRLAIMGDYDNVGIAAVPDTDAGTQVGELVTSANYFYADTGQPDHYDRFLVGTVFDDVDEDGHYDPGEGLAGVTVMPDAGTFFAVTAAGGGYALPILAAGDYDVAFSGGGLQGVHVRSVTVGATSELLDLVPVPEPASALQLALGAAVLGFARRALSRAAAR